MCSEPRVCPFIHCDSGNLFMMNSRNEKGEWLQINYQYVEQELKYLTPSSYTSYTHGIWRTKGKVGGDDLGGAGWGGCLLYTSPSPRDGLLSRMPSSA